MHRKQSLETSDQCARRVGQYCAVSSTPWRRRRRAILFLLALSALPTFFLCNAQTSTPVFPDPIYDCLKSPRAAGLKVLTDINPYYLRGDFDGDGIPDYALQVRSKKGGIGVLVCAGNGELFLLGSGLGGPRFSDMPQDNFGSENWDVETKQDVAHMVPYDRKLPFVKPYPKGESIEMIWEDGFGLIYWDGKLFRWEGNIA